MDEEFDEQDIYDEKNIVAEIHEDSENEKIVAANDPDIEFSNILRDVAKVEAVSANETRSPKLVAVNATDQSLTWLLGRLDHTIKAEKYQVMQCN